MTKAGLADLAETVLTFRPMFITVGVSTFLLFVAAPAMAQDPAEVNQTTPAGALGQAPQMTPLVCGSTPGQTVRCPADTSAGVVLLKSDGATACLLGKTWGYDAVSVWVSDGCAGQFATGQATAPADDKKQFEYIPNVGFRLYEGDKGQIYFRLFSYARYLNQRNLDATYTDAFGNTKGVPLRQDVQLQKFFAPFSGWFMTPKFRYYLYVWSANTSQGDPAQVVGAGNLTYVFNRHVSFGAGITSLPSTRSTEGQFPYWLGVDDRLISDEFFRGSYTSGFWVKGEINTELKYQVMIANNLSTLGVSAAQLDNQFNTQSYSVQWLPTTGEFGLWGTFGDYDNHQQLATRLAAHYTRSTEDRQSQPGTEAIENSQVRLTDGSVIFTPDLFGPGVRVNQVDYQMVSIDGGLKKNGRSIEAEFFWRHLSDFQGTDTAALPSIDDVGYQLQTSAMLVPDTIQAYLSGAQIFGDYGDPWEIRGGANWYFRKERGLRVNGEWIYVRKSPVGYTAYPMPVGGNGLVFHVNLEMNF
jgi:hypothetical protein